ncbi:MAG: hypothetical protein ACI9EF_001087 [Pseudohongiellaceae bacterium]
MDLRAGLLLLCVGCGNEDSGVRPSDQIADDVARARAAAAFTPGSAQKLDIAWESMEPLIARATPRADDLLRAGIIAFHRPDEEERANSLIEQAFAADPSDPATRFMRGCIALNRTLNPELAAEEFRAVLSVDPRDAPSLLQLAMALRYLEDFAGADEKLQAVRDLGLGPNTPFYAQATYQLGQLRLRRSRGDAEAQAAAQALLQEHGALSKEGKNQASETLVWTATYGRVMPPQPQAITTATQGAAAFPDFATWNVSSTATPAMGLLTADLNGDGPQELLTWGQGGVQLRSLQSDGSFSSSTVHPRPVSYARLGDLDVAEPNQDHYHPAPELLCIEGDQVRLYSYDAAQKTFLPFEVSDPAKAGARSATFVDLDHQGSLDIVVSTAGGLSYLRNNGADENWKRILVADAPAPFSDVPSCRALLIEDIDGNQAVDLLAVGDKGVMAIAGMWDGVFADRTSEWGLADVTVDPAQANGGLLLVDVNNDGRADLVQCTAPATQKATASRVSVRLHNGESFAAPITLNTAGKAIRDLVAVDLNRDGYVDLLGVDPISGDVLAIAGPLSAQQGPLPVTTLVSGAASNPGQLLVSDIDGDGALDVALAGSPVQLWRGSEPQGNALTLQLSGRKANTHGVGTIVEVRAGDLYRRIFSLGEPLVIGLGKATQVDVASVRWPDGVVQPQYDLASGSTHKLVQIEGLTGSCPFLYTWNGTTFEFVTDVLGTTPLGLPMAPGVHVPFDHDEYVRIAGDQLVPRNGQLELVLTEELREVTYLDQVRLHAIDHPANIEIHPDEAFVFPPFPPHHVHTFRDVVNLPQVLASNGADVTELLASIDSRHAQTFLHEPEQFRGLTKPWHLDLQLAESAAERAALAAAPRIRLALTGWLLWPDASVNVSAARHPTVSFEPPLLSVPDGDGWRPAGPPIGFIAGKTKTMIVDITEMVDRNDPRLRLSTTLALSYDAIRLVLDDDDAPFSDTPLSPSLASVGWRGFSALIPDPTGEFGEAFDWDELAEPRWDQHPGQYTRYGDVLQLLQTVDDRTVIFGAGDAVTLSFAAAPLPELPEGWTRDWLLYLDGWAKDQDPNTSAARTVEPLPFHAMSDYPPPAGEAFPRSAALDAWRAQYNTRSGRRLLMDWSRKPSASTAQPQSLPLQSTQPPTADDD